MTVIVANGTVTVVVRTFWLWVLCLCLLVCAVRGPRWLAAARRWWRGLVLQCLLALVGWLPEGDRRAFAEVLLGGEAADEPAPV